MKVMGSRLIGIMILLVSCNAFGETKSGSIGDLSETLQAQRDACANMAADAKRNYSLAQYQAGLDRQTAAVKAEMDARVYGVGHGRRETEAFYLQTMQDAEDAQKAKDKANSEEFNANSARVARCVSDAEQNGKSTYIAFKKGRSNDPARARAESLMSAWLENIREISAAAPNGGEPSYNAWKAAKARADVSSL